MENIKLFKVGFDKKAMLKDEKQAAELTNEITQGGYTDLIVLSHGWNNSEEEALDLYDNLLDLIFDQLKTKVLSGRKFIALGVIWPSRKFGEIEPSRQAAALGENIKAEMINQCKHLIEVQPDKDGKAILNEILKLLSAEDNTAQLAEKFYKLFNVMPFKPGEDIRREQNLDFSLEKIKMLLMDSESDLPIGNNGDTSINYPATGTSAGLLTAIRDGVQNMLNVTTYYAMKALAGLIGSKGLNPILKKIKDNNPSLSIHLIGHSFGARLVTSAVLGDTNHSPLKVQSLALLQAAFSHFAFAQQYDGESDGYFIKVISDKLVQKAFIITHSRLDRAVGIAYAIASRLAGQIGVTIGQADDIYGGLGGNGALKTQGTVQLELLPIGEKYSFVPGKVYNLQSKEFITNHSDIRKPEVAQALVNAFLV